MEFKNDFSLDKLLLKQISGEGFKNCHYIIIFNHFVYKCSNLEIEINSLRTTFLLQFAI